MPQEMMAPLSEFVRAGGRLRGRLGDGDGGTDDRSRRLAPCNAHATVLCLAATSLVSSSTGRVQRVTDLKKCDMRYIMNYCMHALCTSCTGDVVAIGTLPLQLRAASMFGCVPMFTCHLSGVFVFQNLLRNSCPLSGDPRTPTCCRPTVCRTLLDNQEEDHVAVALSSSGIPRLSAPPLRSERRMSRLRLPACTCVEPMMSLVDM